jgi:tetratricopeptide (TPR) repeat protein
MHKPDPPIAESVQSKPADPVAEPVRAMLAAGRWRKARDAAKLLCKKDRARYLPLLIEANIGLTRELFAKGLSSEADQVLAYLKTIAPPETLAGLQGELACLRGDKKALRDRALRLLAEAGHGETTKETVRLADDAVLTFESISAEAGAVEPLAAELGAVHQALEAISGRRFDDALDRVRPLARDSVFSHWVRWIKGVIAFYRGDRTRAARCFADLPAESVPARAAAGYRLLISEPDPNRALPGHAELEVACRILGRPGLAGALSKSDALWHGGKPDDAYDFLRRAIPEFPRVGPDPMGALSEFCFHSLQAMTERQRDRMLRLFARLALQHKARSDFERALALRAVCLQEATALDAECLEENWTDYLKLLNRLHGPDPQRDALGYTWLGEQLTLEDNEPGPFGFFAPGSSFQEGSRAVAALTRAVHLDPANVEPQLKLCELYARLGLSSDRNRLLDQMTKRFPDRKEVLLLAGKGCLDRGAFKKGSDYLERARALDPLDPRIQELLAIGRIRRVVELYRARRLEPARQTWAELEELIVASPNDLVRSRWVILARQGVLERCFGESTVGDSRLAEARAGSPSPEAFLFYTHLAQRIYAPKQRGSWLDEFTAVAREGARIGHAGLLGKILHFWKLLLEDRCRNEEKKLFEYIRQAALRPFTRDEAAGALLAIPPTPEWINALKPVIKKILTQDPKDPLFRLFHQLIVLDCDDGASCRRAIPELQSIVEEASRRRDDQTARSARTIKRDLESRHSPYAGFPDTDTNMDAEEEEDEESWNPFHSPNSMDREDEPSIDFGGSSEWAEFIELIANATPGQIKELRRNPPPGVPKEFLDILIRAARDGDWMPPLPPFPPAPPDGDRSRSTAQPKQTGGSAAPLNHPELPF